MAEPAFQFEYETQPPARTVTAKTFLSHLLHIVLFLATFFTTTLAGALWVIRDPLELSNLHYGLPYSISLLAMLTAHEFGHYFAARAHGVTTTLPFYIPFPPLFLNPFGAGIIQLNPFGTMGAVIRIRSPLQTKRALFDIGIAGPIAGLIVTVAVLAYGIITLPGKEYLYAIHPEYQFTGQIPEGGLTFGNSALFWLLREYIPAQGFLPPMNEIYHYPYLCVGWFGLFITALNLLPVGQLDGGHVLYALVGAKQGFIARIFFGLLVGLGLLSFLPFLGFEFAPGTMGWLIWAALLFFVIRLDHPPLYDDTPVGTFRTVLGWTVMFIFLLILPPVPIFE